jgi:hypothetical protein
MRLGALGMQFKRAQVHLMPAFIADDDLVSLGFEPLRALHGVGKRPGRPLRPIAALSVCAYVCGMEPLSEGTMVIDCPTCGARHIVHWHDYPYEDEGRLRCQASGCDGVLLHWTGTRRFHHAALIESGAG